MKLFAVAAVLAVFIQAFDCAPLSSSTSTVTIDGVTITNHNGQVSYTIDGRPATEEEAKAILGPNINVSNGGISVQSGNIGNGGINSATINGRPMTPEEKEAFDKNMEEFRNNLAKQMENMHNQMANAFAPMQMPGWPFNQ